MSFTDNLRGTTVTDPDDPTMYQHLPLGSSSLQFRSPSSERLSLRGSSSIWEMTRLSLFIGVTFWAFRFGIAYVFENATYELTFSLMAVFTVYYGFMSIGDIDESNEGIPFAGYLAPCVSIVVGAALVFELRPIGTLAFCTAGVVCVLVSALAMSRHIVAWHAANPFVAEETRICWRTATVSPAIGLRSRNQDVRELTFEAVIASAFVVALMVCVPVGVLLYQRGMSTALSWRILPMLVTLLWIFNKVWVSHPLADTIFALAAGHWRKYDSAQPLSFESPVGDASKRLTLTWLSLTVLTVSGAALTSSIGSSAWTGVSVGRLYLVALLDTTIAAICCPHIYWLSIRGIVAPVLVAAYIRHEEEAGYDSGNEIDPSTEENAEVSARSAEDSPSAASEQGQDADQQVDEAKFEGDKNHA